MERNLLDHSIPSTPQQDDDALISRIIVAYLIAIRDFPGHGSSGWRGINALADDMHKLLLTGDQSPVSAALRNPHTTDLFAGFDPLNRSLHTSASGDHAATSAFAQLSYLASAAAAMQVPNPETSDPRPVPQAEELLTTLDERFGFTIDFPNPYPFEIGLRTSRGVASHRALHAIYQAWRLWELGGQRSQARIMEIGAGLGRTAYYARKFGMRDYTIIDIPLSNVAQAHFLGSVLGSEAVALVGEPAVSGAIRIIGPSFTSETREKFDIVLNVNSLVEMDRNVADSYFTFAAQHARYFLSINHEHHPFRFIDVAGLRPGSLASSRFPYWMRPGYVEEVVDFSAGDQIAPDTNGVAYRPRRELDNLRHQVGQQKEEVDRLSREAEEMGREAAAYRAILGSRSSTFRRWLYLLRTKDRRS